MQSEYDDHAKQRRFGGRLLSFLTAAAIYPETSITAPMAGKATPHGTTVDSETHSMRHALKEADPSGPTNFHYSSPYFLAHEPEGPSAQALANAKELPIAVPVDKCMWMGFHRAQTDRTWTSGNSEFECC